MSCQFDPSANNDVVRSERFEPRRRSEALPNLASPAKTGGLYSLGGVLLAVGLYSAVHIAARLIASGNLGEDDPLDAILTQTLEWGYRPEQPPLYDWVLWLLQQVFGLGVLPYQLLKYALLTATCGFIFLAARRVMKGDAFWAFLSVEALALIYQISWRFHEGFTHAVGAMCAVAAAFWALLRLIERRQTTDYALFGVILGLGVLTVTTFWAYLAALLGAVWLQPAARQALFDRRFPLALAIAACIAAPHFIWLAQTPQGFSAILPSMVASDPEQHLFYALSGIRRAFTEPVMYLAPLIFLYPLFFPKMLGCIRVDTTLRPNQAQEPDFEQLILHLTLISIAILIAAAAIFGINRYPVHALMPLFLITSIWLTAQARKAATSRVQIRRFVIMALSVAAFALFARAANMYILQPVCSICRWGIPYAELSAEMKARGFETGRLIVNDRELGGNLRRFFPESRIVLVGSRAYTPPPDPASEEQNHSTAFVWEADQATEKIVAQFQTALPELGVSKLREAQTVSIPWPGFYRVPYGNPVSTWRIAIVKGDVNLTERQRMIALKEISR